MSINSKRTAFFASTLCLLLFAGAAEGIAQEAGPDLAAAKSFVAEKKFDKLPPLIAGIEKAAQAGNGDAQLLLGDIFANRNTDLFKDRQAEAVAFYEKALAAGKLVAAIRLGDLYYSGEIVPQDREKAFQYYSKMLTKIKNARVERRVAGAYLHGKGVAADPAKAIDMLTKLSDAGDVGSMRQLGDIYHAGKFTGADRDLAIKYYEAALKGGDVGSAKKLAGLLASAPDADSQSKAFTYYKQAADAGDVSSKRRVARAYFAGIGTAKDTTQGIKLLEELGAAGDSAANNQLAAMYAAGLNVAKDGKKAVELYGKSIAAGDAVAVVRLADLYYAGRVVPRDPSKALSLLTEASDKGNVAASRRLIALYREAPGKVIPKSPAKAKAVFEKAKGAMSPEDILREEILFAAMDAKTLNSYEELAKKLETLPKPLAKSTLFIVRKVNPNAYVYLLQDRLKDIGLYNGRLSGILTMDTIRAINTFCRKGEQAQNCGRGPMSSVVAGQVLDQMFAPDGAQSTQAD